MIYGWSSLIRAIACLLHIAIVPGQHHIATLMMKYCIEHLHQGLLYTEDDICLDGCWGAVSKRRVSDDIIQYSRVIQ